MRLVFSVAVRRDELTYMTVHIVQSDVLTNIYST